MPLKWLLPALACCALGAESPEALLRQTDRLRYPWPSFTMEASIQDGKVQQRWLVRVRENSDARVEGLSPKEKDRTVLLLGDDMWLLLPGTRKPIKVSPQQRLLGAAAGGDIAHARFAEDYRVTAEHAETLENGRAARRFELQARKPSISYRTATLWTTPEGTPLRAEYFLASGKLARKVRFGPAQTVHGVRALSSLSIEEPSGRRAELLFENWRPVPLDPTRFVLPPIK